MDGYNSPFCIRISFDSFFNCFLMLCHIVIIGIQNNEKALSIAVVVITTCLSFTIFCIIRVIEMIHIILIQRIMVTNCSCHCKSLQSICT
mgnify:CR=1 FL=1